MQLGCKCHGMSGSCNLKTCWLTLPPFSYVGDVLKKKYHKAKFFKYHDNKVYIVPLNRTKSIKPIPKRDESLIYMLSSPNYCLKNESAGSYGVLERECRSTLASDVKTCENICSRCGLNASTTIEHEERKCHCRFQWCCTVTCDSCPEKVVTVKCTARG